MFAADTGRPLRRARIRLTSSRDESRTATTYLDGRYEIKDLPAGEYTISASRIGYLTAQYGQRRPLEPGRPLLVEDKQVVDAVDFSLPRMSQVAGHIFDEMGEPLAGVRVFVMRPMFFEGRRRMVPAGGNAITDDAGQYRIGNLSPGAYFLFATLRDTWTVVEDSKERVVAYAPAIFPGAADLANARPVSVGVGAEMRDVDFSLLPGTSASVSGVAVDSRGNPLGGETVYVTQEYRSASDMLVIPAGGDAPVAADGSFTIRNLPPGTYKLVMRVTTRAQVRENTTAVISVNSGHIDGLRLVTSPPSSVSGQITTDNGAAPNVPAARVRIAARHLSQESNPRVGGNGGVGSVKNDWTFAVNDIFGPARLRVSAPAGWMLKAILHEGRDITDVPLTLKSGEHLSGVQVVLTNRVGSVAGQLTDEKGRPHADCTVLAFAADSDRWFEDSRFVRITRPDLEGRYRITGLPPGEYLAVALEYVEEGLWNDPEYLESIRRYGERVSLTEGGARAVSLKVVVP